MHLSWFCNRLNLIFNLDLFHWSILLHSVSDRWYKKILWDPMEVPALKKLKTHWSNPTLLNATMKKKKKGGKTLQENFAPHIQWHANYQINPMTSFQGGCSMVLASVRVTPRQEYHYAKSYAWKTPALNVQYMNRGSILFPGIQFPLHRL